jgi:uncharacterized protein GlcG (DUF336 family)
MLAPRSTTQWRGIYALGTALTLSPWCAQAATSACALSIGTTSHIFAQLNVVANLSDSNGGIFTPNMVWAAVVDRSGVLCNVGKVGDAWPAGRAIAMAAATTANAFSNRAMAFSTANLYAPAQPGGFLAGVESTNPFNPAFQPAGTGIGMVPGGISTVGGGVALYQGGKVIGAIGVAGDTSCADHAIAFRMRILAGLNAVPSGVAPDDTDNIIYAPTGTAPTGFEQPHCEPSDLTPSQIENIPQH